MTTPIRLAVAIALATLTLSCGAPSPSDLADRAPGTAADAARAADTERVTRALASLRTGLTGDETARTASTVVDESRRTGLPLDLILAVIRVESSGNAFAVSPVGAMGLMQLLPATAEEVAERLDIVWTGDSLLFDPVVNVRLGTEYLRVLIERYDDVATGLAAYNWGPGHIARRVQRGEAIPAAYADRVLARRDEKTI